MKTLYYLGPEFTYSHAAARLASKSIKTLHNVHLEPLPSTQALFEAIKKTAVKKENEAEIGVIVPIYNLEQGVVYDFARFGIFDQIDRVQLSPDLNLYSQQRSLDQIKTIYTKDTVVPQVDQRLNELPTHIEIHTSPDISTAEAARMAQEDRTGAAICSQDAGAAAGLNLIIKNIANSRDSYTEFAIFGPHQPETEHQSTASTFSEPCFTPVETPFQLTHSLLQRLESGAANLLWRIAADQHPALHLGHIRNLETLVRYSKRGNSVHVLVDISQGAEQLRAEGLAGQIHRFFEQHTAPSPLFSLGAWQPNGQQTELLPQPGRADIRGLLKRPSKENFDLWEVERSKLVGLHTLCQEKEIDILVGGAANLPVFCDLIQRWKDTREMGAILIDYLPGSDRYAKMSTHRQNHIEWED